MSTSLSLCLLKFAAKACLNALSGGLPSGDFAVEVLPGIVSNLWTRWVEDRSKAERWADVQELERAPTAEVRQQVKEIVREVAAAVPIDKQLQLETYLIEMPVVARRQGVELSADSQAKKLGVTSAVERECLEVIYAYEEVLSKKNGKPTRAARTWQLVNRDGIIGAVEKCVNRRKDPSGYLALVEMKMQDLTFEAVVRRHPDHFSDEARRRSDEKLKELQAEAVNPEDRTALSKSSKGKDSGTRKHYDLFGYPVTAVIRWMGKQGWTKKEALQALAHFAVPCSPNTVATMLYSGAKGDRGEPAPVTAEQAIQLEAAAGRTTKVESSDGPNPNGQANVGRSV